MNPAILRFVDSRAAAAIVVVLFCVTSGLSIYSSNQIAMTLGTRDANIVERASHFLLVAFQLWFYLLYWFSDRFHVFGLHESITSSLLTAGFSAALLFPLVRLASLHFTRTGRAILGLLLFSAVVEAYCFATDMYRLRAIDDSYFGL